VRPSAAVSTAPAAERAGGPGDGGIRWRATDIEAHDLPSQYTLTVLGTLGDARDRAWAFGRFEVLTMYGQPL
jgi:hypothetical protein